MPRRTPGAGDARGRGIDLIGAVIGAGTAAAEPRPLDHVVPAPASVAPKGDPYTRWQAASRKPISMLAWWASRTRPPSVHTAYAARRKLPDCFAARSSAPLLRIGLIGPSLRTR